MPKFCSHGGAWRVKMHICTCFNTTASPNPCIILWDQLQKKDTIITISCTPAKALWAFFFQHRKAEKIASHIAPEPRSRREHYPQLPNPDSSMPKLRPGRRGTVLKHWLGNDEILLWLLVFSLKQLKNVMYCIGMFYSIFLGMIRDEPIEPIVSHRFLFQLSHQDPRVAIWAQRWRRS